MAIAMEELVQAGLCDSSEGHHLTMKGRDLLRALEDLEHQQWADPNEAAADLILSTSGLSR